MHFDTAEEKRTVYPTQSHDNTHVGDNKNKKQIMPNNIPQAPVNVNLQFEYKVINLVSCKL